MATLKRILEKLLNVNELRVNQATIREENGETNLDIQVHAIKRVRHRCPICERKCPGYDKPGNTSIWRSMDFGSIKVWLYTKLDRIQCPQHGVRREWIPWAYHDSGFTKDFDKTVAWLGCQINRSAACTFMRINWATVGRCMSRARADIEPDLQARLNGLRIIGIDETSYKKGHRYITVVVNHQTNTVVWMHDGHGKSILAQFFEAMTPEQRASIEVVTGDGARWIDECMSEYIPNCHRCVDPFHVVQWAMDAVDAVRRQVWHDSLAEVKVLESKRRNSKGRPKLTDTEAAELKAARKQASDVKNSTYALGKAPENLTPNQELKRKMIELNYPKLFRAYARKEELRLILKETDVDRASVMLRKWFWRATHSQIKEVRDLAWKVRRHEKHILCTIRMHLSNARVEAINNKIKVLIRRSYGFRNLDNMFDLVYLCCSNFRIPLPGRG